MLIRTVATVVATNSVGNPIDAIPGKEWTAGDTGASGELAVPVDVQEAANGVPVRFVSGKTALNSAGQLVDTTFIKGGGFSAEANALFARFTTPPTDARKVLINSMIVALKTAGVWTKLDALHLMAAADSQAARQNWIADQYNLVAVASPAFAADRGYTGDGAAAYLSTGFTPSTASGKMVQDSASFGVWSLTAGLASGTTNYDIGSNAGGASRADMRIRRSDGIVAYALTASGAAASGSIADGSGLFCALRRDATTVFLRRNNAQINTSASTSNGLPASPITILAANGVQFSARQLAASFIGAGLSDAESDALYTALNTYLAAIGAA